MSKRNWGWRPTFRDSLFGIIAYGSEVANEGMSIALSATTARAPMPD